MKTKKIVITGGPGTGKSSIIKELEKNGFFCFHEISREITAKAQKQGIDQLFLEKPILFSEKLLKARIGQYIKASKNQGIKVFLDRGIPDVVAYMDFFGTSYPEMFNEACRNYRYNDIFLLPPWEKIYETDNERYESFEQACLIYDFLKKTYITFGYSPIEVPLDSVKIRCEFIVSNIND